jgi:hypothetical protein
MDVIKIDTTNKSDVKRFLDFPFQLYRDVPQWVPPFASDAKRMLDRTKHPFYRHSAAEFFIAVEADRVVGRLAVLDHRPYNEWNHSQTAFVYLFDAENERKFRAVCSMQPLRDGRGLTHPRPKGFPRRQLGLLAKRFEHDRRWGLLTTRIPTPLCGKMPDLRTPAILFQAIWGQTS